MLLLLHPPMKQTPSFESGETTCVCFVASFNPIRKCTAISREECQGRTEDFGSETPSALLQTARNTPASRRAFTVS